MANANLKARPSISQRFLACEQIEQWSTMRRSRRLQPASRIRLEGRWLDLAGFKPHSRVQVQVEQGRLVITPA